MVHYLVESSVQLTGVTLAQQEEGLANDSFPLPSKI